DNERIKDDLQQVQTIDSIRESEDLTEAIEKEKNLTDDQSDIKIEMDIKVKEEIQENQVENLHKNQVDTSCTVQQDDKEHKKQVIDDNLRKEEVKVDQNVKNELESTTEQDTTIQQDQKIYSQ